MKKKRPNVPVFLIYAGIIHAIGLALLLPIMITLPGPGSEIAPETSIIDIEVIPATSDALTIGNVDEQTAALPSVVPVELLPVRRVPASSPPSAAIQSPRRSRSHTVVISWRRKKWMGGTTAGPCSRSPQAR